MVTVFDRHWWIFALRGLAALLFGVGIFAWPVITLAMLVPLFAIYALADGALALIAAMWAARWHVSWWPLLLEGGIDVAAGIVALLWPGPPLFALLSLIATWAVLTGGLALLAALLMRRAMAGEGFLLVGGGGSIVLGLLLLAFPGAGALAVVSLIGGYALLFGGLLLAFAFRLRGWLHRTAPAAKHGQGEEQGRAVFKRILVPLDGSPTAERVLPEVIELAKAHAAEVVLFRVALPDQFPGDLLTDAQCRAIQEATSYIEETERGLRARRLRASTVVVRQGRPAEEILHYAADCRIDLIAMSTHGRTGVRRWTLGSVAEKVLRASPVPLLLVRATEARAAAA